MQVILSMIEYATNPKYHKYIGSPLYPTDSFDVLLLVLYDDYNYPSYNYPFYSNDHEPIIVYDD